MKRILVATDAIHEQHAIRAGLFDSGCLNPVKFVSDASELLDELKRSFSSDAEGITAIILDLDLVDAENILKFNASLGEEQSWKLVVLVRSGDIATLSRAADMGAQSYLPKPVFRVQLAELLDRLHEEGVLGGCAPLRKASGVNTPVESKRP